jgi:hypothetical protein
MKKKFEDEHANYYADDVQVQTVYKTGGSITSLKHKKEAHRYSGGKICKLCDEFWDEIPEIDGET